MRPGDALKLGVGYGKAEEHNAIAAEDCFPDVHRPQQRFERCRGRAQPKFGKPRRGERSRDQSVAISDRRSDGCREDEQGDSEEIQVETTHLGEREEQDAEQRDE